MKLLFWFNGMAFAYILIASNNNEELAMNQEKPPLDPHPLSEYVVPGLEDATGSHF
jgi:hypothetical protein